MTNVKITLLGDKWLFLISATGKGKPLATSLGAGGHERRKFAETRSR